MKAFEVVAENSAYIGRIRVRQSFSNSIYHKFMGEKDNSGTLLLSAVFGTR